MIDVSAVALGRASIEAGYRTYDRRQPIWPGLSIIDEVGYLPLASEAAAALFQVDVVLRFRSRFTRRTLAMRLGIR